MRRRARSKEAVHGRAGWGQARGNGKTCPLEPTLRTCFDAAPLPLPPLPPRPAPARVALAPLAAYEACDRHCASVPVHRRHFVLQSRREGVGGRVARVPTSQSGDAASRQSHGRGGRVGGAVPPDASAHLAMRRGARARALARATCRPDTSPLAGRTAVWSSTRAALSKCGWTRAICGLLACACGVRGVECGAPDRQRVPDALRSRAASGWAGPTGSQESQAMCGPWRARSERACALAHVRSDGLRGLVPPRSSARFSEMARAAEDVAIGNDPGRGRGRRRADAAAERAFPVVRSAGGRREGGGGAEKRKGECKRPEGSRVSLPL